MLDFLTDFESVGHINKIFLNDSFTNQTEI